MLPDGDAMSIGEQCFKSKGYFDGGIMKKK
jgi:hypothetical protein